MKNVQNWSESPINVVSGRNYTNTNVNRLNKSKSERRFTSNQWATENQWNELGRFILDDRPTHAVGQYRNMFTYKLYNEDQTFSEDFKELTDESVNYLKLKMSIESKNHQERMSDFNRFIDLIDRGYGKEEI